MKTTKKTLVYLAAAVWYIGGIMLFRSGLELVIQAHELKEGTLWPAVFIITGIVLGIIQVLFIFRHSCRKNMRRINLLNDPRLWQFYRPGFFMALAIMITSGILLNHFAQGYYYYMLAVAAVDFALTTSLLGSSYVFWTDFKHINS
ncbi:MAG: hypothetical protein KAH12_09235 [Anaerolineales bacterium]|nr:hypothetical protein [Anaerolineales bacterium]